MTTCLKRGLVKCWLASTGNKSHNRAGQTCSRGRGVAVKKEMAAVSDIKSKIWTLCGPKELSSVHRGWGRGDLADGKNIQPKKTCRPKQLEVVGLGL